MVKTYVGVEQGRLEDVAAVRVLIGEAGGWLRSQGIDQWQNSVPESLLRSDAEAGRLLVVREAGTVVASVTLHDTDPEIWGISDSPATYVHRLVVAQSHRGQQMGARILGWVTSHALQHGVLTVRLDCATENQALRRFYECQGFRHLRDVLVASPDGARELRSSLYERKACA